MTTECVRSFLTVRNDDRVCSHFGPVRFETMTVPITSKTYTSASVTRTFLWEHHSVIWDCALRLTHPRTLWWVQKLVPHYFMIGWWMVLRIIIRQVILFPFPNIDWSGPFLYDLRANGILYRLKDNQKGWIQPLLGWKYIGQKWCFDVAQG